MRFLKGFCFLILTSVFVLGQNSSTTDSTSAPSVADELKQLREAVAAQEKQITTQQDQIQTLEQQLSTARSAAAKTTAETPKVVDASLHSSSSSVTNVSVQPASDAPPQETERKESPLSFRIGGAEFTPGGFVDFENVFRTTNTGNVAATSFGAIPFSNQVAGHLTEYRATGQYSRFNIKTHAKFGANDVTGYIEFDFNGNDPANVFVTSNSHTDRIRLYWLDLKRGKWEFLGGQTWGLQTPNRVGVSPNPADLSLGYQEDAGIGVGYNYTRAGEFRAAYHFNDHFVWAVAAQNPQQFNNGEVIFPAAFNAQLSTQFDNAAVPGTPNVGPDVLTKLAFDHDFAGGHHFHWEGGGIETAKKVSVLAPTNTASAAFTGHTKIGGGVFGDVLVDLWKGSEGRNIKFVASGMWGNGIGRYLNGLAPDAIVHPINGSGTTCVITGSGSSAVATGCDADISMVHSGDMVAGFEFLPHPRSQFGVYYGGAYAQRNFTIDATSTAATQPFIGFGFPSSTGPNRIGSANNNNRAVQEGIVDWTQTFWKNPQYGAVLLVTQGSYVTRAPWFVSPGAPKNAHLLMTYVSLRYVLP